MVPAPRAAAERDLELAERGAAAFGGAAFLAETFLGADFAAVFLAPAFAGAGAAFFFFVAEGRAAVFFTAALRPAAFFAAALPAAEPRGDTFFAAAFFELAAWPPLVRPRVSAVRGFAPEAAERPPRALALGEPVFFLAIRTPV